MQRLLLTAGSVLALTACSSMDGMMQHRHNPYAELAKVAKQHDAQHALLLNRDGELVVVNVATGDVVQPSETRTAASMENEKPHGQSDAASQTSQPVSDEEFAEIQRKFGRTITIRATRGSVCMNLVMQPPGKQWKICSPPYPQWW